MKNRFFIMLLVFCTVIFGISVFSSSATAPTEKEVEAVPVALAQKSEASQNGARFLNMLNHNYIYGADFENLDVMVNGSVPALLSLREEDFISADIVASFMSDMYGIDISDMSALNADFPQKEGYLYIVSNGFTSYEHSDADIRINEDGTFLVTTKVTVTPHDGERYEAKAVSLFVKNEASAFGYNIISSEILTSQNSLDM